MANPEHMKILKQGVEIWNQWREKNPEIRPDLSETSINHTNLSGADFRGANFSETSINHTNLSGADFNGADFSNASFGWSNFDNADCSEANFSNVHLHLTTFNGADFSKVKFSGADLSKVKFSGADLSGAVLSGADLRGADLRGADLSGADLSGAVLSGADLRGADLRGADLSGADLRGADLRGADLSGADFSGADLSITNLREACFKNDGLIKTDFCELNFSGVNLEKTNLSGLNLSKVNFIEANLSRANLAKTNLREADLTGANLYVTSRDYWKINDIKCGHVYWDQYGKIRTPSDRDFLPGEFEELYKWRPLDAFEKLIIRSIEFPEAYKQAGVSILNYFSEILRKKYHETSATVQIKQEGLKVSMIIDPMDGNREVIEKALYDYSNLLNGNTTPEEFTNDRLLLIELKSELRTAQNRIETQKELLQDKNTLTDKMFAIIGHDAKAEGDIHFEDTKN